MKVNYKKIKTFMEEYFKAYSSYAQDSETMPKMNKYWSRDFVTTAFIRLKDGSYPCVIGPRSTWQEFLIKGHLNILETLKPKEIIIDEKEKKVAVLLEIKKYDRKSNELICTLDSIGCYPLINEDNLIKIKNLDLCFGDPGKITGLYNM